jgi:hypothetical protein
MVMASKRVFQVVVLLGLTLAFAPAAIGQSIVGESAKLLATDGGSGDRLGWTVSVSGNRALFGAPFDSDLAFESGTAYVFNLESGAWAQAAHLVASAAAREDHFGHAVALSADVAAVGAPASDLAAFDAGAVYVFRVVSDAWSEEAQLLASDAQAEDKFGSCVALSGDWVAVGAPEDDDLGFRSGAVYLFRFDGAQWREEAKLVGSGVGENSAFGKAVSLDGDWLAVGSLASGGAVYVFEFDGTAWNQQHVLPRPGGSSDRFGQSVSLSGDVLLVGAPGESSAAFSGGAVFAYRFDGVDWLGDGKWVAFDAAKFDQFGSDVGVSGNVAVVSAPSDDDGGVNAGSAYVYMDDGTAWTLQAKLLPSDIAATDGFGRSVAVRPGLALVGSPADDDAGSASGSAYAFHGLHDCDDTGVLDLVEGDQSAEASCDPGDFDGDGCPRISDLVLMIVNFGVRHHGGPLDGDMDNNGVVELLDFRDFLDHFGRECHGNGGGNANGHG